MRAYLLAFILFAAGAGYLVYAGFSGARVPHVTVSELLAAPRGEIEKARLFGMVSGEGLTRAADGLGARFQVIDKAGAHISLWVDYKGALPDLFEADAEVIVEGRLTGDRTFSATSLSTKCPSKYEKANREGRT